MRERVAPNRKNDMDSGIKEVDGQRLLEDQKTMCHPVLYTTRDHVAQGDHYLRHVDAMAREGLHSKSRIAGELAARDIEIAHLSAQVNSWRTRGRPLNLADPEIAPAMAQIKARFAADPAYAHSLLLDAGICDAAGKLTPEYGGVA